MNTTLLPSLSFFLWIAISAPYLISNLTSIEAAEPNPSLKVTQVVAIGEIQFTIPDSMQLARIASEPLIHWPVAAAWDHDDSLVVLESNWNRESVEKQLVSRPHRIVRLQDIDADGAFDTRTVVATDLSFSAGILIVDNAIYVSAPPSILRLEDLDGDGVYEDRKIWHDGKTITHCANDLHGPMLGRDGWIYWTKGAFAEQSLPMRDGSTLNSRAAHLLRRHPSGGGVEVLMTGGMDNPVDVAFLPDGERLFCSTFLHHPGGGVRDGIGHAVYGSLFGKPHNVLDGHRRTGPLFAPIEELGPAAPSSLTLLESPEIISASGFVEKSSESVPVVVTTQFNFQKLSIHQLNSNGATFKTKSHDLIVADKIDFHPVDVLEDRDGSLVILDTGGWYDLCCPSSGLPGQIAPGGIYRLSAGSTNRGGLGPNARQDTVQQQLVELCSNHSRRRELASQWLVKHPSESIEPLIKQLGEKSSNITYRLGAFWCLTKMLVNSPDQLAIKETLLACLIDESPPLQAAALNVVSLYRWPESVPVLTGLLRNAAPQAKRLAAECLGRIDGEGESSINALMNAIEHASGDRTLEHAILYALMECDQPHRIRTYLTNAQPRRCWAALRVLQQTGGIQADNFALLVELSSSSDDAVRSEARDILASHPEFANQSLDLLANAWESQDVDSMAALESIFGAWRHVDEVSQRIAQWLGDAPSLSALQTRMLTGIIARYRGESLPAAWTEPMASWLTITDQDTALHLAQSIDQVKWLLPRDHSLVAALLARSQQPNIPLVGRCHFWSSLPPYTAGVSEELQEAIVNGIASDDETIASACANAMSHVELMPSQKVWLMNHLGDISPTRLQTAILSVLQFNDHQSDEAVREAISNLASARTLAVEPMMTALQNRSAEDREAWATTMAQLHAPPADLSRAVDDWITKLPEGDVNRGYQVFRSSKAACSQCHQVGYIGGKTGPELSQIGKSRMRRELVEAVLFPSARLEQSYRSTRVLTSDGRVLNGLIAAQNDTMLELICGVNERHMIPKNEIESQEPSDVSVMPAGLEQSLSLQQFADLISFLESKR